MQESSPIDWRIPCAVDWFAPADSDAFGVVNNFSTIFEIVLATFEVQAKLKIPQ